MIAGCGGLATPSAVPEDTTPLPFAAPENLFDILGYMPDRATTALSFAPLSAIEQQATALAVYTGHEAQTQAWLGTLLGTLNSGGAPLATDASLSDSVSALGLDPSRPSGLFLDFQPLGERAALAAERIGDRDRWLERQPVSDSLPEYWLSLVDVVLMLPADEGETLAGKLAAALGQPDGAAAEHDERGANVRTRGYLHWCDLGGYVLLSDSATLLEAVLARRGEDRTLPPAIMPQNSPSPMVAMMTRLDRLQTLLPDFGPYMRENFRGREAGRMTALAAAWPAGVAWADAPYLAALQLHNGALSLQTRMQWAGQPAFAAQYPDTQPSPVAGLLRANGGNGLLLRPPKHFVEIVEQSAEAFAEAGLGPAEYAARTTMKLMGLVSEIGFVHHDSGGAQGVLAIARSEDPGALAAFINESLPLEPVEGTLRRGALPGGQVVWLDQRGDLTYVSTLREQVERLASTAAEPSPAADDAAVLTALWLEPESLLRILQAPPADWMPATISATLEWLAQSLESAQVQQHVQGEVYDSQVDIFFRPAAVTNAR